MLKELKTSPFPGRFTNSNPSNTYDVVSTWCLILNKINSAKFYIGKHYFGVKTNDFSQEIMFFDSPI